MQSKGMSGKPLTTNPPFGYMKNPENPKEWLIDEPAAKIVRQIFALCVSGLGPVSYTHLPSFTAARENTANNQ